ncbi:GGDEF domain-containing response regulator [Shewanella sp. JM162201]|uniref:GGDEF domain-containing response regulator n=1 Tax=Shewanella jiangmenensis TaxID=2837387 RepID=A0ABS5V0Z9_9GAMM|nr:GGDEF domain-containing response regulator [Shewanella jiangmenensis]MBT1444156.1 GGDEF domain-containing response regulator [Shewanella jiangmenensis]
MNLLLVDDDEVDREMIMRALSQSDREFVVAQSCYAKDAMEMVGTQQFDGILLDYMLPDANGLEVLTWLNDIGKEDSAVVMISRYEDEKLAERCIELGAQDFLLKDEVTPGRLCRAIINARQRFSMARALRQSHEKLKELAEHDSLTRLVNRYGFELCLNRTLSQTKRCHGMLSVILLDLDDFKGVNDTLGHQVGDILLVEVASRLSSALRETDLIARIGGDEFVALICDPDPAYLPFNLAKRLLKTFEAPFNLGESSVMIGASLGIALYGECADTADELLKCADIAMYRAKNEGRNQIQCYSEELEHQVRYRTRIEQGLRGAIARNELKLFYQGKFEASSGRLVGMEALLRWQHPEDGLLAPDRFMAIAEETGLMEPIGEWVLETACHQAREWLDMVGYRIPHLSVAVNFSASQIAADKLPKVIRDALTRSGLAPENLELEITENALIKRPEQIAAALKVVRAMGVTLALDDFGTGYSSLDHLMHFPIQVIKIDKSLVATVPEDEKGCRLLTALLNFSQGFGMVSVAEGIETEAQAAFCAEHGCDLLQGYLLGRPVDAATFEKDVLLPALGKYLDG